MKRVIFCWLIVCAFAIRTPALAAVSPYPFGVTGNLAGKVLDAETGEPLIGVNIIIDKTKLGGSTNENGEYKIMNIPAGRYTVMYSYIGYKKHTVQNVSINVDATTKLDVRMEYGSLEMDEVVVTAERMLLKQDVTGSSHVIEQRQIQVLPIDDFMDVLATQPGVTRDLHVRGGRQSEVLFLVDGLPYTETGTGTVGGMLPKSAIQEMKILTGGFDAEYGNALSGVVNIVTRRGTEDMDLVIRGDIDHYFGNPETNKENLIEFTSGGPLSSQSLKYFTASDFKTSNTRWNEDFQRYDISPAVKEFNNITKFDYELSGSIRLNAQIIGSWRSEHDYEFRWRKNLTGLPKKTKESLRVSVGMSQFLTDNTFYNINVSRYHLNSRLGPDNKEDLDTTDLYEYDFYLQYVISGSRLWWANENQTQWTLKGDLTTQYSDRNTLKFGGEVTLYDMNIDRVKYEPQTTYYGKPIIYADPLNYSTDYQYKPRAGAAFIQNKLRFVDDGTFSLGLRWDFLDPRAQRPNLEFVPVGDDAFKQEIREWVPAKIKHRLSPRVGFAMPFTTEDFFFVNFGYFFQVPLFDHLYSGLDINLKKQNSVLVGNPDMKPQVTKAWEFSYRRQFGEDISMTVTFFDKETENLVDTKTFLASDSKSLDDGYFAQYVNSPYANSHGFEFSIEKHSPDLVFGRLSYTYMVAEGLSEREQEGLNFLQWGFEPVQDLYPLSWDQRHTVNGMLGSNLPYDLTADLVVNYHSPRPYTYYPSRDGYTTPETVIQPNNKRMEHNVYLDLKATKAFSTKRLGTDGWRWLFYVDVRNLLDRKNVLWIASDGTIGGELHDPAAYGMGRRTRIGLEVSF